MIVKYPKLTIKMWDDKYHNIMQDIFSHCKPVLDIILPDGEEPLRNNYRIVYDYLLFTQGHRLMLYEYNNDAPTDTSQIIDSMLILGTKANVLVPKYKGLSALVQQDWTLAKIEELGYDYFITRTGSYSDNEHTYTDSVGLNLITNTRSQSETKDKVRTYDDVLVNSREAETDYQKGAANESTTGTKFDYHKDKDRTFDDYVEKGNRHKSIIEEIPNILEFLNINVLDEFIKDFLPIITLGVYN